MDDDASEPWLRLPRRLFLDSSTLQTLSDYGGVIFENEDAPDSVPSREGFTDDLEALRRIFIVNERALFEFALSPNSLREVKDKRDPQYMRWAFDVLDHWDACIDSYEDRGAFHGNGPEIASVLDDRRFGYLSRKDRLLLKDAVAQECDAFLTMERKLPKHAPQIEEAVGLMVLRPPDYWNLLEPWAALYV